MARRAIDMSMSLEELENDFRGDPTYPSYLVQTCHALRRKPLRDLTDGDLRIAIGQDISLPYLVPLALMRLSADPMLAADYYEGDLLKAVLRAPETYWAGHPDQREELAGIVPQFLAQAEQGDESWRATCFCDIEKAVKSFLRQAHIRSKSSKE
jgi:hypothetical protein